MVKPTLKPEPEKEKKEDDLKDDKLKEWGVLPAAVAIEDSEKEKDKKDAEAAYCEFDNLETDVDDDARPTIVKCCACFAVFTIILIVTCTIGSFIYFHYGNSDHKWKGWCSVRYNDDDNSGENGNYGQHHGDRSSSEEDGHHGGHHDKHPRPGSPGGGRQCGMDSEVDVDNGLERIERPEEEDCERITILHDYNANISAYRLWKSEICYVTWIEHDVLMNPEEFWTNMQDPEYLNQFFNQLSLTYRAVLPALPTPLHEQEDGKYGEYLDGPKDFLCQGAETYWIEKIPEDEMEEFMELVNQIMAQLMAIAAQYDAEQQQQPRPEYDGNWWPTDMGDNPDFMGGDHDGWMGDPYGGRHGGRGGGHHGEHGGHHDDHRGMRRRRGAADLLDIPKKDAKDCSTQAMQIIRELARNDDDDRARIAGYKIVPPCVMTKVNKLKDSRIPERRGKKKSRGKKN